MDQNNYSKFSFLVLECSITIPNSELKEKIIHVTRGKDNLTVNFLIRLIFSYFELKNKKIRLYDFKGIEISEDADLWKFIDDKEKNRIIFFTQQNEIFELRNVLRPFKYIKKLGEGGFGRVYLAEQKLSKELYAIKLFRNTYSNVHDLNFLYKEISILAKLEHRNIIKLHTYCTSEDNHIALVLEYASGGTLREYLREKRILEEPEAKEILKQILDTVNYCHENGIIHRDLKLDNILFTDKDRRTIKIIDFGISGLFKNEKSRAGSLAYMPPEVVAGHNIESLPQIDAWGIGCILYEILTGERLFQGTQKEIKEQIIKGEFTIPKTISVEAAHLIGSLLRIRSVKRLSIIEAINHPWLKGTELSDVDTSRARRFFQTTIGLLPKTQMEQNLKGKFSSSPPTPIKMRTKLKSKTVQVSQSTKNNFKELPKLITKMPNDIKDATLYRYHFSLMRKYKGKIKNFLLPIGHNKEQKHKIALIKECFSEYYTSNSPKQKLNDASSDVIKRRKTINFKHELPGSSLQLKRMLSNQAIPKFNVSQSNLKISEIKKERGENRPILFKSNIRIIKDYK